MQKTSHRFICIGPYKTFFSDSPYDKKNYVSWTCTTFCKMFCFLIDNIYIKFGDEVFRQSVGILMETDCAPIVADLFLFSYEYDFLDRLTKQKKLHLARKFNYVYRYIDDLICFGIDNFGEFAKDIYPKELDLKETTESNTAASYLDLMVMIADRKLQFKLYDKRDDFDFEIVNYPYIESNIPVKPAYGVYVSQLLRYTLTCSFYDDFLHRHKSLVEKLCIQEIGRAHV